MKKIGIIGCGVIGGALKKWLEDNTLHKIYVSDPYKGYNDDVSQCDVFFIQIHIPTEVDGSQKLDVLEEIVAKLPHRPIFIRTTILPGTSDMLSHKYNKDVFFMPEFLTERTSVSDFEKQPMIFTGYIDLLTEIFQGKPYICMSSLEAEITKYAHNVFGALKVTYFNAIYDYCQKLNANYENVHKGILLSGYINDMHTQVPGPDGKFGYGGKCFPKDVDAFSKATETYPLGRLLAPLKELNEFFRK